MSKRIGSNRQGLAAQWHVYESSDRWIHVVRRFAPDVFHHTSIPDRCQDFMDVRMTADGQPLSIIPMGPITPDVSQTIRRAPDDPTDKRVVLWQVDRVNLPHACNAISQSRERRTRDLHMAAVSHLPNLARMALSEIGVATVIDHPEQLPMLSRMVRRYLARR